MRKEGSRSGLTGREDLSRDDDEPGTEAKPGARARRGRPEHEESTFVGVDAGELPRQCGGGRTARWRQDHRAEHCRPRRAEEGFTDGLIGSRRELRFPRYKWAGRDTIVPRFSDHSDPSVEVWRDGEGRVAAYAYTSETTSWVRLPGVAAFAFDAEQDEVTAFPDEGLTRGAVAEAYRRAVLPMFQQTRRNQVLHASAVRASAGVVAFCGTSGTGKSTVAFAFSRRGYPVWGDDAVCFQTSDRGVHCIRLPFDLLLRPATVSFFNMGSDAARIRRAGSESEASSTAPLVAVCILQSGIADGRPPAEVARLSSSDAFTAALQHAYALGLGKQERRKLLVEQYLELVASAPVFKVTFERRLEQLEAVVDAIERHLRLEPPTG
jgi:hypothetical protein